MEIPSLRCAQPPRDASGGVNSDRQSLDLGRGRCLEVRLLHLNSNEPYEPFPGVGYFSFYLKRKGKKIKRERKRKINIRFPL